MEFIKFKFSKFHFALIFEKPQALMQYAQRLAKLICKAQSTMHLQLKFNFRKLL